MNPSKISGWILPNGTFQEVEEWWHIAFLYDLRDAGEELFLDEESKALLAEGDESKLRDLAARKGFVKISRGEVDGYVMNSVQLRCLKELIDIVPPEFEFRVLLRGGKQIKSITVGRILKLRSPQSFFKSVD